MVYKKYMIHSLSIALVLLIMLVTSHTTQAKELYFRYKDENGKTAIVQTINPKYVTGGYELIDKFGQVVQIIPPHYEKKESADTKPDTLDALTLLRSYSRIEDIMFAMNRVNTENKNRIYRTRTEIDRTDKRLKNLRAKLEHASLSKEETKKVREQVRVIDRSLSQLTLHIAYLKDKIKKDTQLYQDRINQFTYLKKNDITIELLKKSQ